MGNRKSSWQGMVEVASHALLIPFEIKLVCLVGDHSPFRCLGMEYPVPERGRDAETEIREFQVMMDMLALQGREYAGTPGLVQGPVHIPVPGEAGEETAEQGEVIVQQVTGHQEGGGEQYAAPTLETGDPDVGRMRMVMLVVEPVIPGRGMIVFAMHPEPVQDVFTEGPGDDAHDYQDGLEQERCAVAEELEPEEFGTDESGEDQEAVSLADRRFRKRRVLFHVLVLLVLFVEEEGHGEKGVEDLDPAGDTVFIVVIAV